LTAVAGLSPSLPRKVKVKGGWHELAGHAQIERAVLPVRHHVDGNVGFSSDHCGKDRVPGWPETSPAMTILYDGDDDSHSGAVNFGLAIASVRRVNRPP
jgi:hypothetical protein